MTRQRRDPSSPPPSRSFGQGSSSGYGDGRAPRSSRQAANSSRTGRGDAQGYRVPVELERPQKPRHAAHSARAPRKTLEQLTPASQTRESAQAYSRRMAQLSYREEIAKRSRRRRLLAFLGVAVVALIVAAVVGFFVYFSISDSRLSLRNSNASEALAASEEGAPFYVLCAADLDNANGTGGAEDSAYMLVRVDEANRVVTFLSLPSTMMLPLSNMGSHYLYEARDLGGDAELISSVSSFAGVPISHYVTTDARGIKDMVNAVGGVTLTLPEAVDDPQAGYFTLAPGRQHLEGDAALTLVRASNFRDQEQVKAQNRALFTMALATKALSNEGFDFATLVNDLAEYVGTDWSASAIIDLGEAMRPIDGLTVYASCVPGALQTNSDGESTTYLVADDDFAAMMQRVGAGENPDATSDAIGRVDRTQITVDIRNGSGVTGVAAQMGELLGSLGYHVEAVGNTDDATTYPETLVIYHDAAMEAAALAISKDIAGGRVIDGGDYYTFDTNVLVIIGLDWIPLTQP